MPSSPLIELTVHERGDSLDSEMDPVLWRRLSAQSSFWSLVRDKRLKIQVTGRGRVRVTGTSHVGRALFGDISLTIEPKIEGALVSLLNFASDGAFDVARLPSPSSEMGALGSLVVTQFTNAVRAYVSRGRERQYSRRLEVSSLAGGRLSITKSLLLRARGLRHLVAFERNFLSYKTPLNRVLLSALREVERLAVLIRVEPGTLARARILSALFADAGDAEVYLGSRLRFARVAEELRDRVSPSHRDVLALGALVLAHQSFDLRRPLGTEVPRAWFVSLETLFEVALRQLMTRLAPRGIFVSRGSEEERSSRLIFSRVSKRYGAKPDIVIREGGHTIIVGDIKYKAWTGAAGDDDLYQLLVHAATFRAETCFLVYPHEAFEVRDLGLSTTGCHTWVFALDIRALDRDVTALYRQLLPIMSSRNVSPAS